MPKHLIGFVVPLVVLVLSMPMILDRVPPNSAYGFRTPKTLSSPEVWYPANRAAGWVHAGRRGHINLLQRSFMVDRSGIAAEQDVVVDDG